MNVPKLDSGIQFNLKVDKPTEEVKASDKDTYLQNMSKLKVVKQIEHPGDVAKARAMLNNPSMVASFADNGDIKLFDFDKLECAATFEGHTSYGFGINWRPNEDGSASNVLITAATDSKICVWDVNKQPEANGNKSAVNTLTFHSDSVNGLDILPSNPNIFATASDDSKVAIWDSRSLESPTQNFQASPDGLNAVCFGLHDENVFLTGGQSNGEIWLWDLRKMISMKPLSSFTGHQTSVNSITFSPLTPNIFCSCAQVPPSEDGLQVFNSDNGVIIWDIQKIGEETFYSEEEESTLSPCLILSHNGHSSTVDDISFSPYDPRTMATVDGARSINVFQASEELFKSPLDYEYEFTKE